MWLCRQSLPNCLFSRINVEIGGRLRMPYVGILSMPLKLELATCGWHGPHRRPTLIGPCVKLLSVKKILCVISRSSKQAGSVYGRTQRSDAV